MRLAAVGALQEIGSKQAIPSLLTKLDDPNVDVRSTVIDALGQMADFDTVPQLLPFLSDRNENVKVSAASALMRLGDAKGREYLRILMVSKKAEIRKLAIGGYSATRDSLDQQLLSRDFDAAPPWLDPQAPISNAFVIRAAKRFKITEEEVRARFQSIERDTEIAFNWTQ
jgi:hypothetical protein